MFYMKNATKFIISKLFVSTLFVSTMCVYGNETKQYDAEGIADVFYALNGDSRRST